jgi:hypothetical protein
MPIRFRGDSPHNHGRRKPTPMRDMSLSPYEQGYQVGCQWTKEKVRHYGYLSAQACLAAQEECIADQLKYLEGLLAGTRESLGKLIAQEQIEAVQDEREAWNEYLAECTAIDAEEAQE